MQKIRFAFLICNMAQSYDYHNVDRYRQNVANGSQNVIFYISEQENIQRPRIKSHTKLSYGRVNPSDSPKD